MKEQKAINILHEISLMVQSDDQKLSAISTAIKALQLMMGSKEDYDLQDYERINGGAVYDYLKENSDVYAAILKWPQHQSMRIINVGRDFTIKEINDLLAHSENVLFFIERKRDKNADND